MNRFLTKWLGMATALAMASPAIAQATFPTAASGVRAPATVPLQCNASGVACAPVTASNPVAVSGTTAIDQTTPGTTNAVVATGNAANAATDSGNPVKIGGIYRATPSTLTDGQRGDLALTARGEARVEIGSGNLQVSVSPPSSDAVATSTNALTVRSFSYGYDGTQMVRLRGDANGLVVQPGLSATSWAYAAATGGIVNTTTAVTIKAAAGAGVRNFVCSISIAHDVLGAATEVALRDGASGTVMWRGKLQTPATDSSLGAGDITFSPCLKGTANTLTEFVTLTAVTGGVFVNAVGNTGS